MIVLDTNVVSEFITASPNTTVVSWLNTLRPGEAAITAVTAGELSHGVAKLPGGQRRRTLAAKIAEALNEFRPQRILPLDDGAAMLYGPLVAGRQRRGRPISVPDAQIAAICLAGVHALATRNIRDFEGTGVDLINPWTT
jgi:predicted nucleic acid-binding protein